MTSTPQDDGRAVVPALSARERLLAIAAQHTGPREADLIGLPALAQCLADAMDLPPAKTGKMLCAALLGDDGWMGDEPRTLPVYHRFTTGPVPLSDMATPMDDDAWPGFGPREYPSARKAALQAPGIALVCGTSLAEIDSTGSSGAPLPRFLAVVRADAFRVFGLVEPGQQTGAALGQSVLLPLQPVQARAVPVQAQIPSIKPRQAKPEIGPPSAPVKSYAWATDTELVAALNAQFDSLADWYATEKGSRRGCKASARSDLAEKWEVSPSMLKHQTTGEPRKRYVASLDSKRTVHRV